MYVRTIIITVDLDLYNTITLKADIKASFSSVQYNTILALITRT